MAGVRAHPPHRLRLNHKHRGDIFQEVITKKLAFDVQSSLQLPVYLLCLFQWTFLRQ